MGEEANKIIEKILDNIIEKQLKESKEAGWIEDEITLDDVNKFLIEKHLKEKEEFGEEKWEPVIVDGKEIEHPSIPGVILVKRKIGE